MGIRIVVADDHQIVRRGVRSILELEPGWKVCAEASNGREAVEVTKRLKPDVVVLDITMPELNGLEAASQILKAVPQTEVVILTIHDSQQVAREVLIAGARGYVLKADADRDLVDAIKAVCAHRPFFTTKVSEMVLEAYRRANTPSDEPPPGGERLTPREREIVQLVAEGKTSKQVATALGITVNTVETHRANIMHKLSLDSVSELVRYAIRNNMVEP